MSLQTGFQASTVNFLVPAAGQTHVVGVTGAPFGAPALVDWVQFAVDNFPFQPQGAYIDNTNSTTPVTLSTYPAGLTFTVPAGALWAMHWPAPNGQKITISDPTSIGSDITNIWFVDYPIIPYQISPAQAAGADVGVIVESWNAAQEVLTQPTSLAQGNLPYRTQEDVPAAEFHYGALSGATTTYSVLPVTLNQNLRKLQIFLTGDAYLAAAGDNVVTVTLNGSVIFQRKITLSGAAPVTPGPGFTIADLEFDLIGLNAFNNGVGTGTLAVTIGTALAGGTMEINSYFTPQ